MSGSDHIEELVSRVVVVLSNPVGEANRYSSILSVSTLHATTSCAKSESKLSSQTKCRKEKYHVLHNF